MRIACSNATATVFLVRLVQLLRSRPGSWPQLKALRLIHPGGHRRGTADSAWYKHLHQLIMLVGARSVQVCQ